MINPVVCNNEYNGLPYYAQQKVIILTFASRKINDNFDFNVERIES